MPTKYFCDFCGIDTTINFVYLKWYTQDDIIWTGKTGDAVYIVCPSCEAKIVNFTKTLTRPY